MAYDLEYTRTLPARRPEGHVPAAPRYAVQWDAPVHTLVCDWFGLQGETLPLPAQLGFFDQARRAFVEADGPDSFEIMRCTDEGGLLNAIAVAYWLDPVRHARWERTSNLMRWFKAPERLTGPHGAWRETLSTPFDRHETIFSEPSYTAGVGRTAGARLGPITTNGYFGAARDRLPISAIDPLESPFGDRLPSAAPQAGFGQRLAVAVPPNVVSLRSGQYWAHAEGEQLDDYENNMRPRLMAGMAHLTRHRESTQTLSLRIMTNLDPDGSERRETSVYAQFLSLAPLEAWAKDHQTHHAIYKHAIAMNRLHKAERQFVSWHELFVLPRAEFEYVNCAPGTGLLPFFDAVSIKAART
jgi:aldoxime dehydratase